MNSLLSFAASSRSTILAFGLLGAAALPAQVFPPVGTIYPGAQYPYSIASADFNMDGAPDLVTCAQSVPGHVVLYLNNNDGTGTFGAAIPFTVANGSTNIAAGDLDGDGHPDIATANMYLQGNVSILWGTGIGGAGALTGLQNLATASGANHVAIGDVNADGRLDLVTSNSAAGQVSVFLNNENNVHRSFLPRVLYSCGPLHPPSDVAIGDLDGDGRPDIVTANNNDSTISVLLGLGGGTFGAATHFPVPGPFYLSMGDLDHDGKLDVVTSHSNAHFLCVLKGDGLGGFGAATAYAVQAGGSPRPSAIGDVDHDGNADVVVCNYATTTIEVFLGDGDGGLTSHGLHGTGYSPFGIVLRDFDADGWLDAGVANYIGNSVSVFLNLKPQPPVVAAFVFDRSGTMANIRSGTNITRAVDTVDFAEADVDWLFSGTPTPRVLIFECHDGAVARVGTSYVTAASAKAAMQSLPAPSGAKPLAAAICKAVTDLVAENPGASSNDRTLLIYSDDGADASSPLSCRAGLPASTGGDSCAQALFQGPNGAFDAGSWQQAVCNIIAAQVAVDVYYFSMFADTIGNDVFFKALCELSGGYYTGIPDASTMPRSNPWRASGRGCTDHLGTTLRMVRDGIPQLGETVQIGCRTSNGFPFLLGVGLSDQNISGTLLPLDLGSRGAPGCWLRTSWDVTDGVYAFGSMRSLQLPSSPALAGLTLYWQGAEFHPANNALGLVTSNLLRMLLVP